eukprot:CAMPEP_0172573268 /NCGR_PEP_ID=MMETSP1067-20121228/136104_1 /TAXON_ID=265564 ORGANISM="Thalassiosira punctigera, Strain Tpunct2005C2" /NCGR_SAMPLE_ID=MMETSP1067 /ASSEMBLY_ACC=CAM_ASM_000444 /LENGTH=227 /DNA_ID=CAMNT_0013365867 /DNA_START=97 /DNA_END=777 /DNA_ORIENTATION=+
MLSHPVAAALLLLGQGAPAAAARKKAGARIRKPHPEKPAFMRKMDGHKKHARRRLSVKEFGADLRGESKKSAELRKKIVDKATVIKPPGGGGRKLQNYNNNNANNANILRKMDGHKKHARRRLSVKEFGADLRGESKKSAELRKKIVDKATVVKPPGGGGRKLQNYNNNNANNANNANGYNYNDAQAAYDQQLYNDANYAYNNKYSNNYNYQNNNANNADNPYNNGG